MAQFVEAIKGRATLTKVFWGYCILGTVAIGVLLFGVFRAAIRFDPSPHHFLLDALTGVSFVAYFLWAHVSLWRCAFNAKHRGWGYVARSYAVLVVIGYFVGVSGNFGFKPVTIWHLPPPSTRNRVCGATRALVRLTIPLQRDAWLDLHGRDLPFRPELRDCPMARLLGAFAAASDE
jgi:hypothetical protein